MATTRKAKKPAPAKPATKAPARKKVPAKAPPMDPERADLNRRRRATGFKPGPVSLYTPELAAEICARIATDGRNGTLAYICKQDGMPSVRTVFNWLEIKPEFAAMYNRAHEAKAELMAAELLEIADDGSNDWIACNDPDNPGYRINGEAVNRSRLRVDTRKWLMARHARKKYGDKQEVEHGGSVGVTVTLLPADAKI